MGPGLGAICSVSAIGVKAVTLFSHSHRVNQTRTLLDINQVNRVFREDLGDPGD